MIRGHDDFVHIRGHEVAMNPSINGVQFWENPHAVFSPGLGVDYIESMNVMTGGYAAEYGNRFGGTLTWSPNPHSGSPTSIAAAPCRTIVSGWRCPWACAGESRSGRPRSIHTQRESKS